MEQEAPTQQPEGQPGEGEQAREAFKPREDEQRTRRGKARGRPRSRSSVAPPVVPEPIPPEEQLFWGRQLQSILNTFGGPRGYPQVDDELAARIGEPAALVARKRIPKAEENPELTLLLVLAPWIAGALRVELERWRAISEARRAGRPAATGTPRDLRGDAQRQDIPDPEFATRPLTSVGG